MRRDRSREKRDGQLTREKLASVFEFNPSSSRSPDYPRRFPQNDQTSIPVSHFDGSVPHKYLPQIVDCRVLASIPSSACNQTATRQKAVQRQPADQSFL
ncbi:hypothetical protein RESH_00801 [Rhodopirellula europaea SH398]|uniref:Uncharacterized protein n=1 Tax=Rhodopirellula europaea SH398 TaxID=1263868 RepID=M5SQU6_9BACT|nr:hypothetical protein RESH_00801 [Rhodopirellula europaea SH398]